MALNDTRSSSKQTLKKNKVDLKLATKQRKQLLNLSKKRQLTSSLKLDSTLERKKKTKDNIQCGWTDLNNDNAYEETINLALERRRNTSNEDLRLSAQKTVKTPLSQSKISSNSTSMQFKSYPHQYKSNLERHFPTTDVDDILKKSRAIKKSSKEIMKDCNEIYV